MLWTDKTSGDGLWSYGTFYDDFRNPKGYVHERGKHVITILNEKRNCHFYEKLGYTKTDNKIKVKEK